MSLQQAVQRFRDAALAKGAFATPPAGDLQLHQAMADAVRSLYSAGPPGRAAFRALLRDPSPHVRSWVAAQLLTEGDVDAYAALAELARGADAQAFTARMTLEEHARGRLRSPFGVDAA